MDRRSALTANFMSQLPPHTEGEENFRHALEDVAMDVLTVEKNDPDFARARQDPTACFLSG